ncbi:Hypothetical protein PP7435_CHR3-0932 [Komagataella phaffii CBS 7435]|uniref:DUF202 domain-containing protein n=1 Tax=Komagataella phaffii (strain ATCC 76273 / CBS 7435 / CECT 11047 / NRRL Y-11430 / Wegner 21-1) TaxID=981350 RepID=F2QWV2_KOMPC|nr:GQ67_03344T0 [Komagataella phaffii]AOA69058.1 GQ68_03313T0 [Komagataella phaffii GS115]CAH2449927.1 Hypothetical protein BQ9382_C3-4905 [Komagataella phaffii CBS 7435]CCA39880.1 Hypothetical protein PP7435_CHR3-0932 [Komagataella phaffii CBS 7435]
MASSSRSIIRPSDVPDRIISRRNTVTRDRVPRAVSRRNSAPVSRDGKEPSSFLYYLLRKISRKKIENKGAVCRDNLANERTVLAYLRTALTMMTVGITFSVLFQTKLLLLYTESEDEVNDHANATMSTLQTNRAYAALNRFHTPLSCTFIGWGVLIMTFGSFRYYSNEFLINAKNEFMVDRLLIGVIVGGMICLSIAGLCLVIYSSL